MEVTVYSAEEEAEKLEQGYRLTAEAPAAVVQADAPAEDCGCDPPTFGAADDGTGEGPTEGPADDQTHEKKPKRKK